MRFICLQILLVWLTVWGTQSRRSLEMLALYEDPQPLVDKLSWPQCESDLLLLVSNGLQNFVIKLLKLREKIRLWHPHSLHWLHVPAKTCKQVEW